MKRSKRNKKAERLGAVLRTWRGERTLEEVSERTGAYGDRIDFSQLSKMERGLAEPQLDVYERAAKAVGHTLEELLGAAFPRKGRRPLPRRGPTRAQSAPHPE